MSALNVSQAIELELLAELMKIEGAANYVTIESEQETIAIHRHHETFAVNLNSNISITRSIASAILEGGLSATHVCCGLVLGGDALAELKVARETDVSMGDIFEKVYRNPFSISKEYLKIIGSKNLIGEITTRSLPPLGKPTTVEEMFNVIEGMDAKLRNTPFREELFGGRLYGVPICFTMLPIQQFLSCHVEYVCRGLKDDILAHLSSMFGILQDFLVRACISSRVTARDNRLCVLLTPNSSFSRKISQYEEELKAYVLTSLRHSKEQLQNYKTGRTADANFGVENWLESRSSVISIEEQIATFVNEGSTYFRSLLLLTCVY